MVPDKAQILQSSTIRWQFVCDEGIWDKALLFQQLAYHLEGAVPTLFCLIKQTIMWSSTEYLNLVSPICH